MAYTIYNTKNIMHRTIDELVDPAQKQMKKLLIDYFESSCAYCGEVLGPKDKQCCDHADPTLGNQIGNRVLACEECNDKEKLDTPWRAFLERKVTDDSLRQARVAKIEKWIELHPRLGHRHSTDVLEKAAELRRLVTEFGDEFIALREMIKSERQAQGVDTD